MSEIFCCKKCENLFESHTLYFLGKKEDVDFIFPEGYCYNHVLSETHRLFAHEIRRKEITDWKGFFEIDNIYKKNPEIFFYSLIHRDKKTIQYAISRLELLCDEMIEATQGKSNISILFLNDNNESIRPTYSKDKLDKIKEFLSKNKIENFCEMIGPNSSIAIVLPQDHINARCTYQRLLENNIKLSGRLRTYTQNYKIVGLEQFYQPQPLIKEEITKIALSK